MLEALADDLNTPKAIAEMHALRNAAGRKALAGTLAFFGFRADALSEWREARAPAASAGRRERDRVAASRARLAARKAKNFAEADRIRDELAAHGRRAEGLQGRHHLGDRAMMARAHPTLALRPFLPADAPLLAEIFRASIEELTGDDYSEAQQEAWASAADDEEAFGGAARASS